MIAPTRNQVVPEGGIKICGIREARHAIAAVDAGADMLGFVFAPSRRRVTMDEAVACIDTVQKSRAVMVGLFVDASADEINATARAVGLDVVQLHGDVTADLMVSVDVPVIHVLGRQEVSAFSDVDPGPIAYMIDGYVPGAHGGTGVLADWTRAASLAATVPLMLAGGLTADNVGEAIRAVRPRAVDVSSGVETDGGKDEKKIRQFVAAAKMAFDGP